MTTCKVHETKGVEVSLMKLNVQPHCLLRGGNCNQDNFGVYPASAVEGKTLQSRVHRVRVHRVCTAALERLTSIIYTALRSRREFL